MLQIATVCNLVYTHCYFDDDMHCGRASWMYAVSTRPVSPKTLLSLLPAALGSIDIQYMTLFADQTADVSDLL